MGKSSTWWTSWWILQQTTCDWWGYMCPLQRQSTHLFNWIGGVIYIWELQNVIGKSRVCGEDLPCKQSNDWSHKKKNWRDKTKNRRNHQNHPILCWNTNQPPPKNMKNDCSSSQCSPWSDWTSAQFSSHQSSDPHPAHATWEKTQWANEKKTNVGAPTPTSL